jgi:4-hydroxybenzoate polyprenyltransferase
VGSPLAALLPFALAGLVLILSLRWREKRSETPTSTRAKPGSRTRAVALLVAILLVAAVLSGWIGGWSLESLLMPVGWLVTGLTLFLLDRFLDRRIHGRRPKVVGPIPFWWVFVWALVLGWVFGMVSPQVSPWPIWVSVVVLVGMLLGAMTAFCFRFGLRFWR